MDVVVLIGRILFAALFVGSAIGHLTSTEAMAAYAGGKRIPSPRLAVIVSGIYILVAAVMIILGLWADLAAIALVPFLLVTAFAFHNFWTETDPAARNQEQIQFLKDLALAGGALFLFVLYSTAEPGLSMTEPLFRLY